MNGNGKGGCEKLSIPVIKRMLTISIGLLITGLAYGVEESPLDADCRDNEHGYLTTQQEVRCIPGGGKSSDDINETNSKPENSESSVEDPLNQDINNADKKGVDEPKESEGDDHDNDKSVVNVEGWNSEQNENNIRMPTVDRGLMESNAPYQYYIREHSIEERLPGVMNHVEGDQVGHIQNPGSLPNEDEELFNIDIETAEPDEVEESVGVAEEEEPDASEHDLFVLGLAYQETSDDFNSSTYSFSYRNHRREWFWPYDEAATHGLDWGIDLDLSVGEVELTEFNALHPQLTMGSYMTPGTYLQAQIGRHALDTDQGDRSITSHRVTALFGLQRKFSMQLESGRDFAYTDGSVTGGITKQLTALEHAASFRWRPHLRLRLQGQGGYKEVELENGNNDARESDFSLLYGIKPGWPWVWVGVGAQYLSYQREDADYWSPRRFAAYGLRFESNFPIHKRLTGSAAANVNRQDEDGSQGTGYELKAGLQYRLYGLLYARLEVSKSKSLQESSTWTSDNVFLSLGRPLF